MIYNCGHTVKCIHNPDFNFSGGCFGTDIIQNCTKLSNIGVHPLSFGPIVAKFHCVSCLIRNKIRKITIWSKKHKLVLFRDKKSLRSYMSHTEVEKHKCSNQIYSNSINLIIYNQIKLKSIKKHINLHNLCKQMPKKRKHSSSKLKSA